MSDYPDSYEHYQKLYSQKMVERLLQQLEHLEKMRLLEQFKSSSTDLLEKLAEKLDSEEILVLK